MIHKHHFDMANEHLFMQSSAINRSMRRKLFVFFSVLIRSATHFIYKLHPLVHDHKNKMKHRKP